MDLGFGSLIEKLEEYFGHGATTAFLSIVAITIVTYCLKAFYQAVLSVSTMSIARLVFYALALIVFVVAQKKWVAKKDNEIRAIFEEFEKKSEQRKKGELERLEAGEKLAGEIERMQMRIQKDLHQLTEMKSDLERKRKNLEGA